MLRGPNGWLGCAAVLAVAATTLGCSEIRLQTVDTQTEVLSTHRKVVAGRSAKVRSRIDGTTLYLQTTQGCDEVQMEEVRTILTREGDEDLTEEYTVLSLATIPLTTGIIMLLDAPNVYEDDRNSNRFNPVGPSGAYVGGTVLTVVGGFMALVPIIELVRAAAAGEEQETTTTRQGAVIESDVQCDLSSGPIRTSVVLRVGGQNITTPGTDHNGHLELDLAKAIPYSVARKAVLVQVIVAGKVVGELDIEPILDAQEEMRREQEAHAWQNVDQERCMGGGSADPMACASVRTFLTRFPEGLHASEARDLLRKHERRQGNIIAEDPDGKPAPPEGNVVPEAEPKADAVKPEDDFRSAAEQARKLQEKACRGNCLRSCGRSGKGKACVNACVEEVCQ